jgi:hypothetical protein
MEIFRNSSLNRVSIKARLRQLVYAGLDADKAKIIEHALNEAKEIEGEAKTYVASTAKNEAQLVEQTQPLSSAFVAVTAACFRKLDPLSADDSSCSFDPETGVMKSKIGKLKPVHDAQLRSRVFTAFQNLLAKLPGRGCREMWSEFFEQFEQLADDRETPQFIHQLCFDCLRKMDGPPTITVIDFQAKHWSLMLGRAHSKKDRLLRENESQRRNLPSAGAASQSNGGVNGTLSEVKETFIKTKFGPVTKFGTDGKALAAGFVRTKKQNVAYCNNWNTGVACTAGVRSDHPQNTSGEYTGMCAFTHACSFCASPGHCGPEKDASGNHVCKSEKCKTYYANKK